MVRKSSLALVIAASLAPFSAHPLGLGEIHLKSALNQELDADIDLLSVKSGELDTVKVELADREAFERAGLQRPFYLTQLRFRPTTRPDGSTVIEVTSRDAIREPFLDFLIEVNWPKGRLQREYTVLLDPPATLDRRPPEVARAEAGPGPRSARAPGPGAAPGRVAGGTSGAPAGRPGQYGPVQANETLWEIAADLRPQGVSIEQMMIALQRANPGAFIGGNVNNLKRGEILRVPAREEIQTLSSAEARAAFLEQTARWEADRVERAGARPEPRVEQAPEEVAEAAAAEEPAGEAAAEAAEGELRIAAAPTEAGEPGAGEGGDAAAPVTKLRDQLLVAREANESARQENVELQSRVQELEEQLDDMQRLLSLKNEQLAQLQATLGEEPSPEAAGLTGLEGFDLPEAEDAGGDLEPAAAEEGAEGAAMEEGAGLEEPLAGVSGEGEPAAAQDSGQEAMTGPDDEEAAGTEMAAETEPAAGMEMGAETGPAAGEEMAAGAGPESESMGPAASIEEAEPTLAQEPQAAAPEPAPAAEPERSAPGGLQLGNPLYWGLGGLAVVLVGAAGFMVTRRRRQGPGEEESILVEQQEQPAERGETPARTGEADSQTDETSFLSDFSPSDIDALQDETGEVDPVSEADVYMAYNRYQQAEELLRQASRREPQRTDLRFKLLEVLFAAQAVDAFVNEAEELSASGVGQDEPGEWKRVASMGRELAPDHPLFAGAEAPAPDETAMVAEPGEGEQFEDLDLGQIESELEAASSQTDWSRQAAQPSDESGADEFGLDWDEAPEGAAPEAPGAEPPAAESKDEWDLGDVEIESSSDFAGEAGPELGEEQREEAVDLDLSELDSMDTGMGGETLEESPYGTDEDQGTAASLADMGGESAGSEDELGSSVDESAVDVDRMESIPDEDSVQIGGLDSAMSEMEASEDLALDKEPGAEQPEPEEGSAADLELGEEDEVATKLDLARAYVDMGDDEGARSILDEVMSEGDEGQKSEARDMLEKLA